MMTIMARDKTREDPPLPKTGTAVGGEEIRVAKIIPRSSIYGPGRRVVIWVQGCSLGCEGCWNEDLWPFKGGDSVTINSIIEPIDTTEIEGITILGGEPLQQPKSTLALIQQARSAGLTTMLYTGFEPHELSGAASKALLLSDIAVVGRYQKSNRDIGLRWRGSTNQRVLTMSERYADLEVDEMNEVEVHMDEEGRIELVGYPTMGLIRDLEERL